MPQGARLSAPLLGARDLDAPLAWRQGAAISAGRFLAEAQALAARLPAQGRPINLCQDRYHFALGLAAALLRGQTSLLPPNAMAETLRQVPAAGAAPYLLADDATLDRGALPLLLVQRPAVAAPATAVPCIDAGLEALCLLTSGSTGAPQPHAKRWGTLVANIGAEAARLAQMLGRPTLAGLTLVATVPPQHSYGLESSVLLALLGGCAFDAGRPYFPADIAAALARLPRPRALVTTPFHLKTLLRAGVEPAGADLLLSATAPLSPQLAAQAERELGATLIEIYGCTEAGQVATRRTTAGDVWTALGELRLTAEPGDAGGRVVVAGGHVGDPTPLADILELQSPTRFRLLGRANDLIHVAGKRSSLAHLNFHLNRIPGVEDGAFWLPDEIAEGVVRTVAFVVAPTLRAGDIVGALRGHLEPLFIPRRIVHVEALPREATGKLTAAALRRLAEAHLGAGGAASGAAAIDGA
ncbi:MAG: acyl-CoA synthetase, partial [Burkholderiales bacterium]|nr:acyl-CoA synthetase [Burkholderiales bacterium]